MIKVDRLLKNLFKSIPNEHLSILMHGGLPCMHHSYERLKWVEIISEVLKVPLDPEKLSLEVGTRLG